MSDDRKTLLTVDGKGKAAKLEALERLLAEAHQRGCDAATRGGAA